MRNFEIPKIGRSPSHYPGLLAKNPTRYFFSLALPFLKRYDTIPCPRNLGGDKFGKKGPFWGWGLTLRALGSKPPGGRAGGRVVVLRQAGTQAFWFSLHPLRKKFLHGWNGNHQTWWWMTFLTCALWFLLFYSMFVPFSGSGTKSSFSFSSWVSSWDYLVSEFYLSIIPVEISFVLCCQTFWSCPIGQFLGTNSIHGQHLAFFWKIFAWKVAKKHPNILYLSRIYDRIFII